MACPSPSAATNIPDISLLPGPDSRSLAFTGLPDELRAGFDPGMKFANLQQPGHY
jgi:hypothetical protein